MFGDDFDKDNMTDEQQEMYDQNMEDIRQFATAKSRAYMDFSTGGSIIKSIDPALPYLNAAAVGSFASAKYIAENPVKFGIDAIQLTAMGIALTAGGSVYMLSKHRDDDEEEDKDLNSWQLFMREYRRVPTYVSDRYYIVFTGKKDDRGGYQYVKIAKNHALTPFASLAESIMFNTFNAQYMKGDGYEGGVKIYSDEDIFFNASRNFFNNYNAFGFDPLDVIKAKEGKTLETIASISSKVFSRNPVVGGTIEVATNYDLFRGKPIDRDRDSELLKPKYRGYRDNSLEKFWIDASSTTGIASGAQMKFAFEKILTSPATNPGIALLYAVAESKSLTSDFMSTKKDTGIEKFASQLSKRAVGYTNPNYNPNPTEQKKKISEIMYDYIGDVSGRDEIIYAFADRVSDQLKEDKDYVSLMNDTSISNSARRVGMESKIATSVNDSTNLQQYLDAKGLDQVTDEEMAKIINNVDISFSLSNIQGGDVKAYYYAIRRSKNAKQLAAAILEETSGMSPLEDDFNAVRDEVERVYKVYKSREGVKGKSFMKDFNKEYLEAYEYLQDELPNRQ